LLPLGFPSLLISGIFRGTPRLAHGAVREEGVGAVVGVAVSVTGDVRVNKRREE